MEREKIQQVLGTLPAEVDVDEFVEKLFLLDKIEVAEKQLARGEGVPHEEATKRLERWLE